MRLLGGIEHTFAEAGPAETRARRVNRAISERSGQQVVQVPAFGWQGGLGTLHQVLQRRLLLDRVDQFQRRDAVLRLDKSPAGAAEDTYFRRQRGGRRGTE